MNLFECIGGGGSGELQETVLWTNSSPASNFAAQDITLSDDINNYDYLKFYSRATTSNASVADLIVSVDQFKLLDGLTNKNYAVCSIPYHDGSYAYTRRLYYKTDTSITFMAAMRINSQSTDNAKCIPTAICGLKYAKPKPSGTETVLWTNSDPTSSFASQTVTLSDSAYNYRYLKVSWYGLTSNTDLRAMLVTPSDLATNTTEGSVRYALCCQSASSAQKARAISLQSANQLYFGAAVNWSGAATTMNTACIPYQIIGIS